MIVHLKQGYCNQHMHFPELWGVTWREKVCLSETSNLRWEPKSFGHWLPPLAAGVQHSGAQNTEFLKNPQNLSGFLWMATKCAFLSDTKSVMGPKSKSFRCPACALLTRPKMQCKPKSFGRHLSIFFMKNDDGPPLQEHSSFPHSMLALLQKAHCKDTEALCATTEKQTAVQQSEAASLMSKCSMCKACRLSHSSAVHVSCAEVHSKTIKQSRWSFCHTLMMWQIQREPASRSSHGFSAYLGVKFPCHVF